MSDEVWEDTRAVASPSDQPKLTGKKRGRPVGSRNREKTVESLATYLLGADPQPSTKAHSLQSHINLRTRLLLLQQRLDVFQSEIRARVSVEDVAIAQLTGKPILGAFPASSSSASSSSPATAGSAAVPSSLGSVLAAQLSAPSIVASQVAWQGGSSSEILLGSYNDAVGQLQRDPKLVCVQQLLEQ